MSIEYEDKRKFPRPGDKDRQKALELFMELTLVWLRYFPERTRTTARYLADTLARYEHERAHDALTGVWSSSYMGAQLAQELASEERKTSGIGVIYMDLDHFKQVNDTKGHDAGDTVLKRVGTILEEEVNQTHAGIAGRWLKGDEFLIIYPGCTEEELESLAKKVGTRMGTELPESVNLEKHGVTASMGGVFVNREGSEAAAVARLAEQRMYEAKKTDKNIHKRGNKLVIGGERAEENRIVYFS